MYVCICRCRYDHMFWLIITATRNCDATCGKTFSGMQTKILNPDGASGDGEIAVYSRNVFMGYAKVHQINKEI